MPLIIGFGNKARNGKDEAIKAILADIGTILDARAYGFGDALKREVNEAAHQAGSMKKLFEVLRQSPGSTVVLENPPADGVPEWLVSSPGLPDWVVFDENAPMDDPLSPYGKQRTLLQWWGTEFRRYQDPNYWVKKTIERINSENPEVALIRDMRFPNEFAAIQEASGYTVKVIREGFVSDVPEHYSEKALDEVPLLDWDYVLSVPDGQLELLKQEAVNAFGFLWDLYRAKPYVEFAKDLPVPTSNDIAALEGNAIHVPVPTGDNNPEVEVLKQSHLPIDHGAKDWTQRFCK